MIDLDNPELQNALQIIQFTRRSLFLTGKAGTGKSTFLRYIAANTKKKLFHRKKEISTEVSHVVQVRAEGPKAPSPGHRPGYDGNQQGAL